MTQEGLPPLLSPSSLQELENQLEVFARRIKIENLWYNKKTVPLDGYHFLHCRFDNCQLSLNTSNFEMTHCLIDASSVVLFGGEIVSVLKLFNRSNPQADQFVPGLVPTRYDDGTITITSLPF